jgi:hypothetical protein
VWRNAPSLPELKTGLSIHRKSGKYAFNKEDNHTKMFLITVVITTYTVHIE